MVLFYLLPIDTNFGSFVGESLLANIQSMLFVLLLLVSRSSVVFVVRSTTLVTSRLYREQEKIKDEREKKIYISVGDGVSYDCLSLVLNYDDDDCTYCESKASTTTTMSFVVTRRHTLITSTSAEPERYSFFLDEGRMYISSMSVHKLQCWTPT